MDIFWFFDSLKTTERISVFLSAGDPTSTLLYFYSTVAQAAAALFAVSGIFLVFKIQSVEAQLSKGYDSYREWLCVRLSQPSFKVDLDLLCKMGFNLEPKSWLEKDVVAHTKDLYKKSMSLGSQSWLTSALKDYYHYFLVRKNYKYWVKLLSIIPMAICGLILLDAVAQLSSLHFSAGATDFVWFKADLLRTLLLVKLLIVSLFVSSIFCLIGPFDLLINNPLTHPYTFRLDSLLFWKRIGIKKSWHKTGTFFRRIL